MLYHVYINELKVSSFVCVYIIIKVGVIQLIAFNIYKCNLYQSLIKNLLYSIHMSINYIIV